MTTAPAHSHDHSHQHGGTPSDPAGTACCSHHNVQLERYTRWYLVGGTMVLATIVARTLFPNSIAEVIAQVPAFLGALLLGYPLFKAAVQELWKGSASTSSLASLAIIAAIAIGDYVTAGLLAFILLVADQFVRQRAWGAQRAIEDLIGLTPDTARIVRDGSEVEVKLDQVRVGDTVRVRPGENLPVDGVVVSGTSAINQASLTGEAVPHEVQSGAPVYAGTTNLSGVIDLRATLVGEDTTIGKVTQLIREAEQSKTPRQLIIEQVSKFFVPVTISVAFVVWFLTKDVERAISVLIVACPSALLLSSPMAMVASFAAAARLGILIKRTHYLEASAGVDTVVLDKTGTITTGVFAVSRLVPADGVEGAELLQAAADGEQHSNHPLATSIMSTALAARIKPDQSSDFEEVHGRGIRARTSMGELCVGRASWLVELFPQIAGQVGAVESRIEGMTGVHVVRNERYLGVVGLEDKMRTNARGVIDRLREIGVRRLVLLTGDRISVAERVGRAVGADVIEAECHPEEKHALVQSLGRTGRRVMMVGDGINDGPSLAEADVGVAMGGQGGSDIAANSAGVVLINDDLARIPFLIELARRTRAIIVQNIVASILIAVIGLTIAATGYLGVLLAALYHGLGDVFVIGNSFRLFRFGEAFSEGDVAVPEPAPAAAPPKRLRPIAAT
ncbi:MAG: cation-translocating P-type ATPase [Phycisphaeraceae bacterium]|nr:cation-translocating P-type ATPase [Phycisphaeraceae bacterium]